MSKLVTVFVTRRKNVRCKAPKKAATSEINEFQHSLIVKNYIRCPQIFSQQSHVSDPVVLVWVPLEQFIYPSLVEKCERRRK